MQINSDFNRYTIPSFNARPRDFIKPGTCERLAQYLSEGKSTKEMATILGLPISKIYSYLKLFNLKTPTKEKRLKKEAFDENFAKKFLLVLRNKMSMEDFLFETKLTREDVDAWIQCHRNEITELKNKSREEMFQNGLSTQEVAKQCGITRTRAQQIRKELILSNKIVNERTVIVNDIVERLKKGEDVGEISMATGVNIGAIKYIKRKYDIKSAEIAQIRTNLALDLYKQGFGLKEIAFKLKRTYNTIQKLFSSAELKPLITEFQQQIEDEMLRKHLAGSSYPDLAKEYKICDRTAYTRVLRAKKRIDNNTATK